MPKQTKLPVLWKVRHKVATYLTKKKVGQTFTSTQVCNSLRQWGYTQRNYVSKALVWYAKQGYLLVLNPEVHAFRRYKVVEVPPLLFNERGGGPHINKHNESVPPKRGRQRKNIPGLSKAAHEGDSGCNPSPKERLEALEQKVATLFDRTDGIMDKVNGWL